ncbi:hypothetical protein KGM_208373 [Danaus plexippus plexippus]|uniref:Uncharacterized protein n=1 Tax=Danaus plexippus plexippus TaxID=278856 RepID=A0A212FKJ9_DANPL|nr:hypothetical protein KGM_208373 [Danaus plexippus plexippus]
MQQCGFCSMLSGLLRRAMCVSSRRGSSESYYRELGDQDTLKIEDRLSMLSNDSDHIIKPPTVSVLLKAQPAVNRHLSNRPLLVLQNDPSQPAS